MNPPPRDRVLLVDDEPDIQGLLVFNLKEAGFEVHSAANGNDGFARAQELRPEVIVLDLMLPDTPGTEVCRRIRAQRELVDSGIMMLTARGDEYDRVLGFEVGADDYVVKPFSVRELVLRVKGLAARSHERRIARGAADTGQRLAWRGIEIDVVRHVVTLDKNELSLRPLEFKLLALFLEHPGQVFSRAELLADVWGITAEVSTRTVDTHVKRLRERLGPYGDAVETVHGFGYRLRVDSIPGT
ncbi:MAG: response regulator [Polyangiaceae bacterium]